MFLSTFRYLQGYIKIRISGFSPERFINACKHRNIRLWNLSSVRGEYETCILVKDFKKLKPVLRKTGTKITIVERFGLPFFIYKRKNRKAFIIGFTGCLLSIYILSLFIWNIEITGNTYRTDEMILDYLKQDHIKCGEFKSNFNCGNIAKDIRKNFDDIIWVSVSMDGCKLIIQIKENESIEPDVIETLENSGIDLVADKEGVVTKIITRKGTPLVKPGDEVKQGDVLVSGYVSIFDDNKEIIGYQRENAQADIQAKCILSYNDSIDKIYYEKEYEPSPKYSFYLRIHKWILRFGQIKTKQENIEIKKNEKQLRLNTSFYLPIYIGKECGWKYKKKKNIYNENAVQKILTANMKKTCEALEKKGVEIIENNVKIYNERNSAMAEGTLTIICDIGEEQESKIPELPMEEVLNGND